MVWNILSVLPSICVGTPGVQIAFSCCSYFLLSYLEPSQLDHPVSQTWMWNLCYNFSPVSLKEKTSIHISFKAELLLWALSAYNSYRGIGDCCVPAPSVPFNTLALLLFTAGSPYWHSGEIEAPERKVIPLCQVLWIQSSVTHLLPSGNLASFRGLQKQRTMLHHGVWGQSMASVNRC